MPLARSQYCPVTVHQKFSKAAPKQLTSSEPRRVHKPPFQGQSSLSMGVCALPCWLVEGCHSDCGWNIQRPRQSKARARPLAMRQEGRPLSAQGGPHPAGRGAARTQFQSARFALWFQLCACHKTGRLLEFCVGFMRGDLETAGMFGAFLGRWEGPSSQLLSGFQRLCVFGGNSGKTGQSHFPSKNGGNQATESPNPNDMGSWVAAGFTATPRPLSYGASRPSARIPGAPRLSRAFAPRLGAVRFAFWGRQPFRFCYAGPWPCPLLCGHMEGRRPLV